MPFVINLPTLSRGPFVLAHITQLHEVLKSSRRLYRKGQLQLQANDRGSNCLSHRSAQGKYEFCSRMTLSQNCSHQTYLQSIYGVSISSSTAKSKQIRKRTFIREAPKSPIQSTSKNRSDVLNLQQSRWKCKEQAKLKNNRPKESGNGAKNSF